MAYTSFDPRDDLIASFTSDIDYDRDGTTEKCIAVIHSAINGNITGKTINIPVLCVDKSRVGTLPYLPIVEVTIVTTRSNATNLGQTRYNEALIDFNLYVQNMQGITIKDFTKAVLDTIVNGITTFNRTSTFTNFLHAEVSNDGRIIIERVGDNIITHKVLSVRANRYDSG